MPKEQSKILITGASSGIGLAIASCLIQCNYQVVALARNSSRIPTEVKNNNNFTFISVDFFDLDTLPSQLKSIQKKHNDINSVICCAGKGRFASIEEFSYSQIKELIDLNFTSQAFVVRAFLPRLKQQKNASIVFIGSEAALKGGKKGAIYSASKFALRGFAQAIREECSSSNIGVTIINPGMVNTPFFDQLDFSPGPDADNYIQTNDLANTIVFILESRQGTVFDEINLSPLKKVIDFKK